MRVIEDVCICDKGRLGDQGLSENQISVVVVVMRAVFVLQSRFSRFSKKGHCVVVYGSVRMKEGERELRIRRAKASEPAVKRDSRNQDRTSTSTSP
jgi:hypothetical protein